jgi:hypothetical protein
MKFDYYSLIDIMFYARNLIENRLHKDITKIL